MTWNGYEFTNQGCPARKLGKINGRNVHRFHVEIEQSGLGRDLWEETRMTVVIAHTAVEAANHVRDQLLDADVDYPTTITTWGPRGGATERFIGWSTLIGETMFRSRNTQLNLEI